MRRSWLSETSAAIPVGPSTAPFVLQAGFHAVAGVPISHDGAQIGAINLYASASRAWTTDEFAAVRLRQHGIDPDAALEVLRGYARSNRAKLHDVAADIVRGTVDGVEGTAGANGNAGSTSNA